MCAPANSAKVTDMSVSSASYHHPVPLDTRFEPASLPALFERTVRANQAPFQRWLRGDRKAMSIEEKEGALLFFGKAQCDACHSGPALNSMTFHALGMADLEGPEIRFDPRFAELSGEISHALRGAHS